MQPTIDRALARRLLNHQKAVSVHSPIGEPIVLGTDHAIFPVGENFLLRLPRGERPAQQVTKEQIWLPRVSSSLSFETPTVLHAGTPNEFFPFPWSVYSFVKGEAELRLEAQDTERNAKDIADLILQLRRINVSGGPVPGEHNFDRGCPIIDRIEFTNSRILEIADLVELKPMQEYWASVQPVEPTSDEVCWVHGDIQPGNLVYRNGELVGIIDFGGLAFGDGAVDLIPSWNIFSPKNRKVFLDHLGLSKQIWSRGRAWAFSIAVLEASFHRDNQHYLSRSLRVIREVLIEWEQN